MTAAKYLSRLLRRGQALFRADWQARITQDSLVVLGGQAAQLVLGLGSSVLLAKALGPAEFSVFSVVGAVMMIVATVADLGLSNSAIRFIAGADVAEADSSVVVAVYGRFKTVSGLITAVLLIVLASPVAIALNLPETEAILLIKIAGWGIAAISLGNISSTLLRSTRHFKQITLTTLTNSGLTLILITILFLRNSLTVIPALWIGVIAACAAALCGYWLLPPTWRQAFFKPHLGQIREAKQLLTFGKWLWLASIFTIVAARLDLLMINWWLPPATVGIYALASNLALKAGLINQTLHIVLLPVAASLTHRQSYKKYVHQSLLRSLILAALIILILPLAGLFIATVYGPLYTSSIPIFYLLMIVILLDLITSPLLLLAYPLDMPRLLAASEGTRVLLLLLIGLLTIPVWGLYGAILAKIISKVGGILVGGLSTAIHYRAVPETSALS